MRVLIDPLALLEEQLTVFTFIQLDVGTVFTFTDCDVPVYIGEGLVGYSGINWSIDWRISWETEGNEQLFEPRGFEIDSIESTTNKPIVSCSISIDNIDKLLTMAFMGTDTKTIRVFKGIMESDSFIHEGYWNSIPIFDGIIDKWVMKENIIEIDCINILGAFQQKTLTRDSSSCRWKK